MVSNSSYISEKTVLDTILKAYEESNISLGQEVILIIKCMAYEKELKDQVLILTDLLLELLSTDEDMEIIAIVSDALHTMVRDDYL